HKNLPFASETRRLLHGDLGFDNLIVNDGKVTAVIDWAQMGYGDWMRDYAKFDFWWPDRYTKPQAFADGYDLDAEHLEERIALYWAVTALGTISFADRFKSERVTEWLHDHATEKVC
ncbi:MAG: phosphotransferase, partial [Candidatus Saccharibacteria bacterium]